MGFRTVVIKERSKLDLKMNYLVCRNIEETRVFLPEISCLILESTAISITTALLSELVKQNIKVIFCDEKHNPQSELVGYYGNYNCAKKLYQQLSWKNKTKAMVWSKIVRLKIEKQRDFLVELNHLEQANLLNTYLKHIEEGDITNREGHAAKVYFNALFGLEHSRRDESFINRALNYGYSIVLSCFNREIVKSGYLTQLGIWHCNEFNEFNLSCDLIEPFRILIDKIAYSLDDNDELYKDKMLGVFNKKLIIDGKCQYFENAISIYCNSVFQALLLDDDELLKCYV